ncbi:MAG: lipopolysaccharide biosynthesis protein [Armatimonadota bacterium]|nr:lipopolysaccharide biosynthesis protein [Armatimonadota bacterium]
MAHAHANETADSGVDRLSELVRRGALWTLLYQIYTWGVGFGSRIVLARLLAPHDFGLVALVTLVQGAVLLFGLRGVSAALIQQPDDLDEHANASFWLNPLIGGAIGVLVVVMAPQVAQAFAEPLLAPLLQVAALSFFIVPWGATHAALLAKTLDVPRITMAQALLGTATSAGMVGMALLGYGAWSFIVPGVLADPFRVYLHWRLCSWRPRLAVTLCRWRELVRYARHIWAADALRYCVDNTDYLLVGRLLGASSLGLYSFAFRQSMFAVHNATPIAARIAFPTFALLQTRQELLRRHAARSLLLLMSVTLPLQLGQLALAPEYIAVVYSAKWLPAVGAFRVLLLYGISVAAAMLVRQVLTAVGHPQVVWKFHALVWPALGAGALVGVRAGIAGVALAVGVSLGLGSWLFIFYGLRLLRWPAGDLLAPLVAPAVASAAMYATVALLRHLLLAAGASPATVLAVCIPAGAAVYALTLAWRFPQAWADVTGFAARSVAEFRRDAGEAMRYLRRRLSLGAAA